MSWAAARGQVLDPIEGVLSRFRAPALKELDSIPRSVPASPANHEMPEKSDSEDKEGEALRQLKSLDRVTLYEKVWSQPVQTAARSYGISGRGLGKICGKLGVPTPPRGYWARVQNGQKVGKPRLPGLSHSKANRGRALIPSR